MTRHKLHCWDARSGNETKLPISEHSGVAGSAVFSPDGRHIVSGSHDSAICIWDSETGQLIGLPMQGHSQDVWSVAPPPDGCRVVSGSSDRTISIWDTMTGKQLRWPMQTDSQISTISLSPVTQKHAISYQDGTIDFWDYKIGATLSGSIQANGSSSITSASFSPDGGHYAFMALDGTISMWSTTDSRLAWTTKLPIDKGLHMLRFSPDGTRLVVSALDGSSWTWMLENGTLPPKTSPVHSKGRAGRIRHFSCKEGWSCADSSEAILRWIPFENCEGVWMYMDSKIFQFDGGDSCSTFTDER